MSRNRTPQRKPAKPLSDTNRERRARRGERQASQKPKPAPATEPVAPQPMPAQEAALLPTFARELVRVDQLNPEEAVPTLPPTDQAVEDLLEQLGSAPPPDRAGLPADHPAHRLSTGQWVRLQVTLEAMGRGENAWRAMEEVLSCSEKLDKITRQILAFGEAPDLRRRTFGEPA
ncbi:hypothetical protein [Deinococcus sp. Leaf326]|uniref:hypothetical protein n=1 Tax=Deinococcus sp. Leaf326 TaxID=1736338 RepID=UPI0006F29D51|nr:hypothetical protein [Deinococcus sp. Leaf326]KQR37749.1 hypothetical protein ASF71_14810 [Deinococcus sp. Leaf326]